MSRAEEAERYVGQPKRLPRHIVWQQQNKALTPGARYSSVRHPNLRIRSDENDCNLHLAAAALEVAARPATRDARGQVHSRDTREGERPSTAQVVASCCDYNHTQLSGSN